MDDHEKIPMLEPYTVKECVTALSETEDYNHRMLGIPEMWKTTKGKGVRVAVLDTGCPQHIDLKVAGYRDFSGSPDAFDHAGHGCVSGDVLVHTSTNGICRICDLYEDTDVKTRDVMFPDGVVSTEKDVSSLGMYTLCLGKDGKARRTKITKLHKVRVTGDIVRVSARGLPDMRLTPWHEVPVVERSRGGRINPEWRKVRADELTVGSALFPCNLDGEYVDGSKRITGASTWRCSICGHEFDAVRDRTCPHIGCKRCGHYDRWTCGQRTYDMTPDLAWLIGYLTADGHIVCKPGQYRAEATSTEPALLEACRSRARAAGFRAGRIDTSRRKNKTHGGLQAPRWLCDDKSLANILSDEGLAFRKTYECHVASCISRGDIETVYAYLAGVIDGDGCVDPDGCRVRITTVSKNWANELCALLRSIGVTASIRRYKNCSFGSETANNDLPILNVTFGWIPDGIVKYMVHPKRKKRAAGRVKVSQAVRSIPITAISTEPCDEFFYDITVEDEGHTYIANGTFVSNTHCCGIIAALVNGIGVRGISPEVDLYCGKVLGDDGSGSIDAIAKGIRWAVDEVHADVINMSLGCPPSGASSLALRSACQYAHEKGVVLCCAAGNDSGKVNAPANLPTTIAVAAVDRNKEKAYFTCHGSEVDFAAGGVDVFSTWLNNQYAKLSGTSMATPVITGVVALVQSAAKAEGKSLTVDEVYNRLVSIAVDVEQPGKDDYTGNGIPVFTSQWEDPAKQEPTPKKECWLVRLLKAIASWFKTPEET